MGQGDHPVATMTRTQSSFNIKGAFDVNPPELIEKKYFTGRCVFITGVTENEATKWCREDLCVYIRQSGFGKRVWHLRQAGFFCKQK